MGLNGVYYDEVKYWNARKNPVSPDGRKEVVTWITHHLKGAESILDFGPGIGGTFSAYHNAKQVNTVDISTLYYDQLYKEAKKYPFKLSTLLLSQPEDATHLPFETNSHDFAVTSQVILHMKPHYVNEVLIELGRIAKEVAVITYMDPKFEYDTSNTSYPKDRYCFNYNIPKMCKDLKLITRNVKFERRNVWLIYSKIERTGEIY